MKQRWAFKAEIAAALDDEDCWPQGKNLKRWLDAQDRGMRNDRYVAIKKGNPVPHRAIVNFLAYVRQPAPPHQDPTETKKRQDASACILRFLNQYGVPSPEELEPTQMIEHLCASAAQLMPPESPVRNVFFDGLDALAEMFKVKRIGHRHVKRIANEEELRQALRWFFEDGGNLNVTQNISTAAAIAALEKRFQMTIQQYEAYAVACWRKNEWTVVMTRAEDKMVGMSMVLPLREQDYLKVRGGFLMSCHTDPSKFVEPSRNLIIEALTPRPLSADGEPIHHATKAMRWTVLSQIAALSRFAYSAENKAEPLRLLGIEGTPDARKSLIAFGYNPIGTRMHISGEPLYEKLIQPNWSARDGFLIAMLNLLSGSIGDRPPP